MEELCAADLMIPIEEYPCIGPDQTLREAMSLLISPRYDIVSASGRLSIPRVLMVVDDKMRLVGMLGRRNILRGLERRYLQPYPQDSDKRIFPVTGDPNLADFAGRSVAKGLLGRADRRVREVMVPVRGSVRHDDHITHVLDQMLDSDVSVVPVLDGDEVVGVVRTVDVFYEITRFVLAGGEVPEGGS